MTFRVFRSHREKAGETWPGCIGTWRHQEGVQARGTKGTEVEISLLCLGKYLGGHGDKHVERIWSNDVLGRLLWQLFSGWIYLRRVRLEAGRPIIVCGRNGMVYTRISGSQNVSYRAGRTCVYMKLKKEPVDKKGQRHQRRQFCPRDFRWCRKQRRFSVLVKEKYLETYRLCHIPALPSHSPFLDQNMHITTWCLWPCCPLNMNAPLPKIWLLKSFHYSRPGLYVTAPVI